MFLDRRSAAVRRPLPGRLAKDHHNNKKTIIEEVTGAPIASEDGSGPRKE